jgi:putative ABC transport system substrate-binding protein
VVIGVVSSLSRPGGNITGASFLSNSLETKRLGMIRLLVPRASVMAALINPDNASAEGQAKDLDNAARLLGVTLYLARARSEEELEVAFQMMKGEGAAAVVVGTDSVLSSQRERLVALAARYSIPAIYSATETTDVGGLMSYAARNSDADHQAGIYVGRILKGEQARDLPVILPTKFELVVNLKTASALSLPIPDGLLLAADRVIE